MSTNHDSRLTKQSADQKMADGTQKYLSQLASLPVGGGTYTPAQVIQIFKDRIASNQAAQAAAAQRTAAVKADNDKRAQTDLVVRAFRRMVQGMFSQSPDTLAAFGLEPLKVGTKTVKTKAAAVAKSLATRAARHTMGSRQREQITGATASATPGSSSPGIAATPGPSPVSTPGPSPVPTPGPSPAPTPVSPSAQTAIPASTSTPAPTSAQGAVPAPSATVTTAPAPAAAQNQVR